jgi:hypothetical protein
MFESPTFVWNGSEMTGSCVRMVYDNLDTFIRWRVLQFLDVHGEQADELDERIARFLRWHRSQALPKYARDAEDASRRISRGLSPADLVWGYDVSVARRSLRVAASSWRRCGQAGRGADPPRSCGSQETQVRAREPGKTS